MELKFEGDLEKVRYCCGSERRLSIVDVTERETVDDGVMLRKRKMAGDSRHYREKKQW